MEAAVQGTIDLQFCVEDGVFGSGAANRLKRHRGNLHMCFEGRMLEEDVEMTSAYVVNDRPDFQLSARRKLSTGREHLHEAGPGEQAKCYW